jgi:hypothetical protein
MATEAKPHWVESASFDPFERRGRKPSGLPGAPRPSQIGRPQERADRFSAVEGCHRHISFSLCPLLWLSHSRDTLRESPSTLRRFLSLLLKEEASGECNAHKASYSERKTIFPSQFSPVVVSATSTKSSIARPKGAA